ncbi:MAG: hypothetical protein ACFCU4_02660 [Puniceicoccaceae bacterium]
MAGFAEVRGGVRSQPIPEQNDLTLGEARLQLTADRTRGSLRFRGTIDLLADAVSEDQSIDLRLGEGPLDLREVSAYWRPGSYLDLKVGRQVATWGTGDLIFINDLFPKDFKSFFLGRDQEYLKAPSDAIRVGLYSSALNLDLVATPRFNPDRYLDGDRISFYNPQSGESVGKSERFRADLPDRPEFALRAYRLFDSWETAAYFYYGFWKSPSSLQQLPSGLFQPTFSPLTVYGASLRGPLLNGIAHAEFGWYHSRDDSAGSDPLIANSERRYLLGYEQELATNLTLGLQTYLEETLQFEALRTSLPPEDPLPDRWRHQMTLRLTKLALQEDLTLSLFIFWSPTDQDIYARPKFSYRLNQTWTLSAGANLFQGKSKTTFWGQFQDNTNLWLALRASF